MRRFRLPLLLLGFFLSGGAGLIYQVAWTKALGLVFGHTVYAITTVLAAFMGGLAAGSIVLGGYGKRHGHPIALYAKIEFLIAATGALSLIGVLAVRSLYAAAHQLAPDSTPFLVGLRFVATVLVLFPPTFLMGGTLPILTAGVMRHSTELGARLSRLYWINTTGAVVGALAAGFLLLPEIGLRMTVLVAVALNVLAGGLALAVGDSPAETPAAEHEDRSSETAPGVPAFLLVSFAVVGATAMTYEVAWSRLLATTLGSSTYAFTIMLATFLAGIGLGGRLFEIWVRRAPGVSVAMFAATQTLTGVAAVVFLVVFQKLPAILWAITTATDKTFGGLVLAQFATAALAMLPTAMVFGFNFPLVVLLVTTRQKQAGSPSAAVGRACAANTFGAILGAVAAGFWLVPRLGSFRLVAITAVANLVLAAFLVARHVPRRMLLFAGNALLATLVAGAGWFGLLNDQATASFGVLTNSVFYAETLKLEEVVRTTDVIFVEDGLNASIAVIRSGDFLGLRTNGKVDASSRDKLSQLMAGHLGAVFHPAPRKVLIIGFGSGMTVSAVARYPDVERIDCVEIEPAVIHAAPYLQALNRGVLDDPRVHIIVNDARNFLFTTRDQYDLIISEPSNPWIAGVASLFTDEFYGQVRTRLAPGGILVQWVQAYSIYPRDLRMVLGTVAQRFPQVSVWRGERGDVLLLVQSEARALSLDRVRHAWSVPALREDYATLQLTRPEGILAYHLLDDADLRKLAAGTMIDTDDLTRLEYRAPLALLADATAKNVEMLAQQRSRLLPATIAITDERSALIGAAETSAAIGDTKRAGVALSALSAYPASADVALLRAKWLASSGQLAAARTAFGEVLGLDPSSLVALHGEAELARRQKDFGTAERLLQQALIREPHFLPALESYALLERGRQRWSQAADWQTKRVAADPSPPSSALVLLARMLFEAGRFVQAERLAEELLNRDPYNGQAHGILGETFWRQSRWSDALPHFEAVIHYYPAWDPQIYVLLANVYRNLDRGADADATARNGERIFPGNVSLAVAAARYEVLQSLTDTKTAVSRRRD